MMRSSRALALIITTLAVEARAAPVADGRLGAPCAGPSDCGDASLVCFTAVAGASPGPAFGLCTMSCSVDEECRALDPDAVCSGICLEGCKLNQSFDGGFLSSTCHGREDMACSIVDPTASLPAFFRAPACTPRCSTDEQCGNGLFCNTATGLCDPARLTSDSIGSACDTRPPRPCAGICAGACLEPCVLGSHTGCAATAALGLLGAACLDSLGGTGVGDLGTCAQFCNCSSDCPSTMVCEPRHLEAWSDAAGACEQGPRLEGAPDCLTTKSDSGAGRRCPNGPVRACLTGDFLGTALCNPDGTYGPCVRLPLHVDAIDAGAMRGAAAPKSHSADGDASMADGGVPDAGFMEAGTTAPVRKITARASSDGCSFTGQQRATDHVPFALLGMAAAWCVRRRQR